MASCTCENWTLEELANALQSMTSGNKKISVPMFQRGKRWNRSQQQMFIDSLIKGYPVGTMLFYKRIENNIENYILVDGLQRGTSIKKYLASPTDFFYDNSISDDFCDGVLKIINCNNSDDNRCKVRTLLTGFIKEQRTYKNLQFYSPAKQIVDSFEVSFDFIESLIKVIEGFFTERQSLYDQIAKTEIPVIVYQGAEENLPEIFDRINSQGTPLDQYEVYAAAWPINQRFKISNVDIVEAAIRKYDAFIEDGFIIHGYDREAMRRSKEVNAFEYLFGLSKYLVGRYDILGFQKSLSDDTVNPLGFELVNACLNDTDRIKSLYKNIYAISNVDKFEKALYNAIDFVSDAVSAITRFKGNKHSEKTKLLHSKYQILSMISTTFKEMYVNGDYNQFDASWNEKKDFLSKNLRLYYVYDIITNYWSEGGTGKIHSVAKPNRYMQLISPRIWRSALDGFFDKSMFRTESRQIASPKSEEYAILNCIYLNTFTAMDQLSLDKFDVEHIAPKEQMKRFLIGCDKDKGLPISCIANLCYLPEYVNRSKKDRNFYQDQKYLTHIDLKTVEQKYSFTTADDLEWMDMDFKGEEDFNLLKDFYTDFCQSRFGIMKKLFCESMGIDYEAMQASIEDVPEQVVSNSGLTSASSAYASSCIKKVEDSLGKQLIRINKVAFKTPDNSKGFVFCFSKAYKQGNRERYWYAYRPSRFNDINDCLEKYVVYGCKNSNFVLVVPLGEIEGLCNSLNFTLDEDEKTISHWHINLYRDKEGHMTQLLSKPEIKEIDMDCYKI